MARSKPTLSQSSTYGQACMQCYKAKCRCLRLKKRCQPSESIRRRNGQTAEEADMRIARLEDKMESLLSTMQSFISSQGLGASGPSVNVFQPLQLLNGGSISSSTSYSNGTLGNTTSATLGFNEVSGYATDSITTVSPNPSPLLLSANQADERLNFFRARMLPHFPFIDLTPHTTSQYLRQNRPFLFQAIYTVTIFSTQERLTQVEQLKRQLFTSALLEVQSNIDLLLGLLTYLAWSTDAFLGRADLLSRLMMLALSLVYDLRLFKPSSLDVQVMMNMTQGRVDETSEDPNNEMSYDFLERQRAVLACFILSSNISSHLGRQDAIRWTPQMEEALRVIRLHKSCPDDELFVAQVRLQVLKQKADYVRQQDESGCTLTGTAPAAASAPRLLYLKTLRRQLQELRSSFPPELHQIDILNTHAQYVEFYINQLAYSISRDPPPLDLSGQKGEGGILLGFERLECLWQSVESIKSWMDDFYGIHCVKLVGQPFHFWSQMILSITLLKYLSTLQDPDWDCQAVRNTVDLISTMDRILQKLELSSKEPELQCDDHLLKYLSKLLTKCRIWAEARWNTTSQIQEASQVQDLDTSANPDTVCDSHHIPDLDQMVWMQSMDLGDDQWFENVLGIPTPSL